MDLRRLYAVSCFLYIDDLFDARSYSMSRMTGGSELLIDAQEFDVCYNSVCARVRCRDVAATAVLVARLMLVVTILMATITSTSVCIGRVSGF